MGVGLTIPISHGRLALGALGKTNGMHAWAFTSLYHSISLSLTMQVPGKEST